ncbi:MAG TPA: Grx4 family monothiol glutaredoxin [Polyangiaceae bacterium]|nr:Grx4 family monothiol glutaredoxin [Polyangiaceae bacterium]
MALDETTRARIEDLLRSERVVLFMKGNRHFPQCGFSATVVNILNEFLPSYKTINVLADPALREGIKEYTQWPTIPQLYVGGEFVGGCDIVKELYASGELATMLGAPAAAAPAAAPAGGGKALSLRLSEAAAKAMREALGPGDDEFVRLEVSPRYAYDLSIGPRRPGDVEVEASGLTVLVDAASAARADGTAIDFVDGPQGGFKISNPGEPPQVRQLGVRELKAMLERKAPLELFDVRTEKERAVARIEGARLLDAAAEAHLRSLPKDATIVFHCHHGGRSQAAAERFLAEGYRNVYNLKGGIDAWSLEVDPSVPRY